MNIHQQNLKTKRLGGFEFVDQNKIKGKGDFLTIPQMIIMRKFDHKKRLPVIKPSMNLSGLSKPYLVEKLP